jgi:multicomponent Na+:H+ antiporter subunit D
MVGALSISAFPLFSGFVSKTMILEAAAYDRIAIIWLMLSFASVGTFLSVGLKLPYFTFLGKDCGLRPQEAPTNMLVAMGMAAFLCIFIGVVPGPLYAIMPFPVDYNAYTIGHVIWELQLLLFAGVGFFLLLKYSGGTPKITLDVDWTYRRALPVLIRGVIALAWPLRTLIGTRTLLHMERFIDRIFHYHGPDSILARSWPTGTTVLWVVLMLMVYLLFYYL